MPCPQDLGPGQSDEGVVFAYYAEESAGSTPEVVASRRGSLRVEPHPVSASAEFFFDRSAERVTLEIFDPSGRRVDALEATGLDRLSWQSRPSDPPGVYWARLRGASAQQAVRFVVLH